MLPSMTGLDLANRLAAMHLGMKVLFTTTYSPYALKHHGAIEANTPFAAEPFTIESLATGVQNVWEFHR